MLKLVEADGLSGRGREQARIRGHRSSRGYVIEIGYAYPVALRTGREERALTDGTGPSEDHYGLVCQTLGYDGLQITPQDTRADSLQCFNLSPDHSRNDELATTNIPKLRACYAETAATSCRIEASLGWAAGLAVALEIKRQ